MKKLVLLLACVFVTSLAMADNDKPITVNQLPAKAQTFLGTYFKGLKVLLAKQETELFDKSYEVTYSTGEKVEFNKDGDWTEVRCRQNEVPAEIVPEAIRAYVQSTYPDAKIMSIERGRRDYEINLSNRLELTFNSAMQIIDIDD